VRRNRGNRNGPPLPTDDDPANSQRNRIRGPHSALTDFLASNNISANQIRQDYEQRRQEARREAQQNGAEADVGAAQADAEELESEEALAKSKKRKRESQKAVDKIKANKKAQKGKNNKKTTKKGRGNDDEDEDEDAAFEMYSKALPMPGQLENCALCHKRFTVTTYSKNGPQGGLLCPKCSKELDKNDKKAKPKKKPMSRANNRQIRSDHLDGLLQHGAKTLSQLCIQKIANSINDVDDFGELPESLREALSKILTKKRILDSRTLDLMLNPSYDSLPIYDAAKLTTDDFLRIFAVMPMLKRLRLDNAGQFKDACLKLMTSHPTIKLSHFAISGANLLDSTSWTSFFKAKGSHLTSLWLSWIDGDNHFSGATLTSLVKHCSNLERLKLQHLFALTPPSIPQIANLKHLAHLSLHPRTADLLAPLTPDSTLGDAHILPIINKIGPQLQTLSLRDFNAATSDTLSAIHENCSKLTKLRITYAPLLQDPDFVLLFTDWRNPPLRHADFTACRHVDAQNPHANELCNGLCADGFEALMAHSGPRLETLTVTSCRHITNEAFSKVFIGEANDRPIYPHLANICVSFCGEVDDLVVEGMFRACPKLRRLKVFGCFRVRNVKVPRGVVLLGRSGGADEVAIEGEGYE
jgi:DNA repair protein RAD7